jgi:hypothetical protein
MKNYFQEPIVRAAAILALGPILAAAIGGYALYQVRSSTDVITVTGSARETVSADHAKWTINVTARTGLFDQNVGYTAVSRGVEEVKKKLTDAGITDIELNPQSVFEQYGQNSVITGYQVAQDVVVQSDDVNKIKDMTNDAKFLQGTGYLVHTGYIEYTYTKLDEMRVKLLSNAIKDSKARADSIMKEGNQKTGKLKSASSGVVQVLPKNGVDISDYGSYDTQSVEKDVMVTVRAVFGIN